MVTFPNSRVHPLIQETSNGDLPIPTLTKSVNDDCSVHKKRGAGDQNQLSGPELPSGSSLASLNSILYSETELIPSMDVVPGKEPAEMNEEATNKPDVTIDFSNINDAASASTASASPSSKPMISNHKLENSQKFYLSAPYKKLEHPADKSLIAAFLAGIVFLLFSLIVMCPIWALVILLVPFGYIIKKCLASCCCCCACGSNKVPYQCCAEKLNQSETFWLHDGKLNKMVVQCLIRVEHGLDFNKFRELFNARIVMPEHKNGKKVYPRFMQKLITLHSGYAWMKDENFSLESHFYKMPNSILSQIGLENHISNLASQELSHDKPLWEIHILSDFGDDQDMMILFRFHPSLCDGVTYIRILLSSLADGQVSLGLKPTFGRSAYLFNMFRSIVIGPLVFLQRWIFTRKDVNILHGPKLTGYKTVVWSEPYNLGAATRTKQVTRTALNDVILAATAGSLRTYLQMNGVQNPYDIIANIPVDLRSNNSKITMGVINTLLPIILPTSVEGAVPRLWQIKHHMDDVKNSVDPAVTHCGFWMLLHMFPECLGLRIFRCIYNKASCLISNLQGPDVILTLGTREIRSIVYWVPLVNSSALSISFLTYADQLRMAVIADKEVVPNPRLITKEFNCQVCSFT